MNTATCEKCGARLIAEELSTHTCFTGEIKEIWSFDWEDYFRVYDGKTWYKWQPKPPNHSRMNTQDETRKDDTVPLIGGIVNSCIVKTVLAKVVWVKMALLILVSVPTADDRVMTMGRFIIIMIPSLFNVCDV